ncbi:MAG: CsgG/HfaB family protein, partial [Thermovirgaceae bacterium]
MGLFVLVMIVTMAAFAAGSTAAEAKPRVAVIEFQDAASSGAPARAITDMLVTELFNTNLFTIIERSRVDSILLEHSLVLSGTIDPATAAQVGKLLGVEYLITGSITEYRHE